MKGDFHVRFRENAGVKLPGVTRLAATQKSTLVNEHIQEKYLEVLTTQTKNSETESLTSKDFFVS